MLLFDVLLGRRCGVFMALVCNHFLSDLVWMEMDKFRFPISYFQNTQCKINCFLFEEEKVYFIIKNNLIF